MMTFAPLDTLGAKVDAGGTDVVYDVSGMIVDNTSGLTEGPLTSNHGDVPTSAAAIVGAPSSGNTAYVSNITFKNTGVNTRIVSVYLDRNDAAPDFDADTLIYEVTLNAGEKAEWTAAGWRVYDSSGTPRMALPPTLQEFTRRVTADVVNATVAFADITGLVVPVGANRKYAFQAMLFHHGNATTSGHRFAVNGPAAPTALKVGSWSSNSPIGLDMVDIGVNVQTAYDTALGAYADTPGATAANAMVTMIYGLLENGANAGNLAIRCASEVAVAAGITVHRGSWLWVGETDS
jgi:hypothetical protein